MEQQELQNLKYGIIYIYCDRSHSTGFHNAEAIVEKFVAPMQIEWIDDPGRDDLLLIARRFNVGNIGRYATVSLSLSRMNRSGGWFEAIHHFADELMGVTDAGDGDLVLNESDYGYLHGGHKSVFDILPEAAPQDHTRVKSSKPSRWKRFNEKLQDLISAGDDDDGGGFVTKESAPVVHYDLEESVHRIDPLQEEEDREIRRLERDRKEALERIKRDIINYIAQYHDDPKDLMAELLRGKVVVGKPGRLLVNGDMKIVLPDYDEMEIVMPAMCRTLYILFMKNRKQGGDGIVLKNIDEHRGEIMDIYSMVKPGANELRVKLSVDNLCDPLSDSLNQKISRINRCIRNVITDKQLAKAYTISGKKGEPYSIGLDPDNLELPRAVTGS
ncbi:MAG: hypothetical protein IJK41_10255 [Muribaculaceae bacterium]|nr:hypothetical protein [Muribaculaceae bacterium]